MSSLLLFDFANLNKTFHCPYIEKLEWKCLHKSFVRKLLIVFRKEKP